MNKDVYGILGDLTAEILLEIIAECMDDYLYVIDLQNNKMEISQSALDRFMISETHMRNVKQEIMSVVYKEDRTMFAKHMQAVMDGKEKVHDIHYRWLDKNGLPVWVNCRGVVIDDEDGKPGYLVGCLNETGNQRRADNVTGLLGGMEFCAYLRSQKKPVTTGFLMHIGIDDFATVNETHGSNYGDYVLKSVADCMKECLFGNQRLYHLVADQYVIVDLDSTSMDDAIQLKKKIGEKIDEFIISEKYEVVFSASAGVIDASTVAEGYEECRKKFEFSLKKAKRMGKNNIYFYRQEDYEKFQRNGRIISALRNSIANGCEGFEVYYQPVYSIREKRFVTAEALSRLHHPGLGPISPEIFIRIAEQNGQINEIGLQQFRKVCRMVQKCPEIMQQLKNIKYNLSPAQLLKKGYVGQLLEIIREHGLEPSFFQFEITETVATEYKEEVYEAVEVFVKDGIGLCMDDFGSGYANLNAVLKLPFQCIKMDRSMLNGIRQHKVAGEFYRNIVTILRQQGYAIVAEGVEEQEEVELLEAWGVDMIQGYYFSRPLPVDELLKLLNM